MSAAEMMGVPPEHAAEFNRLHDEAWALCHEGNQLPHWRDYIDGPHECCSPDDPHDCCCCDECDVPSVKNPEPEPFAHYDKATPELRARLVVLKKAFRDKGFPEPLTTGYGWFYGGGVWFTGGKL